MKRGPIDCVEFVAQVILGHQAVDYALWVHQVEKEYRVPDSPQRGDIVLYLNQEDGLTDHMGVYLGGGKVRSKISADGPIITLGLRAEQLTGPYGTKVEFRRKP